jgi:hypothetical protein
MSSDATRWIYESPDSGKTITRRQFGNTDKETKASNNAWYTQGDVFEILAKLLAEQKIREENPAVMAAWEEYQLLLKLVSTGIN